MTRVMGVLLKLLKPYNGIDMSRPEIMVYSCKFNFVDIKRYYGKHQNDSQCSDLRLVGRLELN